MTRLFLPLMALTLFALPALAANPCAPRDKIIDRLASKYGETRQSVGLGANNSVVEVYASDSTGTWTITVTLPDGRMCLIASGESYETLAKAAPASGDDV